MPRVFGFVPDNIEVVSGLGILSTRDEIRVDDVQVLSADTIIVTLSPNTQALPDTFYRIRLLVDNLISRTAQIAWSSGDIVGGKKFRIPLRGIGRLGDNYIIEVVRNATSPVSNILISDGNGQVGEIIDIPVIMETVPPSGLAGYQIEFNIDSGVVGFNDVVFPSDFGLNSHTPAILTGKERKVEAAGVDAPETITGGTRDVLLCTLQIRANRVGMANIDGLVIRLDDDSGSPIAATFEIGTVNII